MGWYLILAEGVDKGDEVSDDVEGGVARSRRRRVGVAVAAQVGSHGSVATSCEAKDLMAPAVPEFGEAVDVEDEWAIPFLCYVHVYAVYAYRPMQNPFHHLLN